MHVTPPSLSAASPAASHPAPSPPAAVPAGPCRILLVDDNRAIHDDFRKILLPPAPAAATASLAAAEASLFGEDDATAETPPPEESGPLYLLDSAYQGAEAVAMATAARAEGRPYAMAFIDVRMPPGMDGVETTAALWRVCPDLQVVICTAYSDYSWDEMKAALGRSDRFVILKKPFDSVEAQQLAAALTEKWRLVQENLAHVADLERRVAERTAALATANTNLRAEVETRRAAERALAEAKDAAERADRAKSVFLANMSHEIRTPMNGVIGMANLLRETGLNPEQADLAETLCASGDALLAIINDILDFSKIEAGRMELESCDFDLPLLIERVLDLHAAQIAGKPVELIWEISPDAPAWVRGDPTRLRQVLLNLVGNAVKFTAAGEVSVFVRQETRVEGISCLRFEVNDTGIGMDSLALARVFQPFVQADDSTTRRFGGTGLGLAICKRIVELMGGRIGVKSSPGEGSTFWFTVPLPLAARSEAQAATPVPDFGRLRALVVDDNATNRKLLRRLLCAWGLPALEVCDGPAALRALEEAARGGTPFDLVLLDYQMPGMDGLALAAAIQARADLPTPALIMLTSHGERLHGPALTRHGLAACQLKPLHPSALRECIAEVLGRRCAALPPTATAVPASPARPESPADLSLRVLVVEDNLVNQKVIQLQLRRLGLTADIANNGLQGIAAVERQTYDLVLMDACMPEMDGLAATRHIRHRQAEGDPAIPARLVIIAMTANALPSDRAECLAAGMDDYISKPVDAEVLRATLARHFAPAASFGGRAV